jgi:hypothetical protein
MVLSMFDLRWFDLACVHQVALGRLDNARNWACETCGRVTDLQKEPHRSELAEARDTSSAIDAQARARGETVTRDDP